MVGRVYPDTQEVPGYLEIKSKSRTSNLYIYIYMYRRCPRGAYHGHVQEMSLLILFLLFIHSFIHTRPSGGAFLQTKSETEMMCRKSDMCRASSHRLYIYIYIYIYINTHKLHDSLQERERERKKERERLTKNKRQTNNKLLAYVRMLGGNNHSI